ncbi:UDP-galactose transporter [Neoconidiobolus thromboides FSU 785]|nr:UDP-galactose transporter [Neoconidiobolus thromboides FSU 785]
MEAPKAKLSSVSAILAYCSSSILMTLVNKLVLSYFRKPPIVFLLLAIQAGFSVGLVQIFGAFNLLKFRSFNLVDGKKWFPVSFLMATMLYTGGKSLEHLPVPLFTIFKNLTIIAVAYGENLLFKSKVTNAMLVSFGLMVLSSIVGGWAELEFNAEGYFWMFLNCISSAVFVLFMRKVIKTVNFKDFDTVYFNNLLTLPLFLIFSLLTENWPGLYAFYFDEANSELLYSLLKALVVSGLSAFAISYTSAWCIRVTNSTTYSMTGALNKLPIAVIGMLYFKDKVTTPKIMAIIIAFLAGIFYSKAKTWQQQEIQEKTNMASNDYQQLTEQQEDNNDNVLPIAMNELDKKN